MQLEDVQWQDFNLHHGKGLPPTLHKRLTRLLIMILSLLAAVRYGGAQLRTQTEWVPLLRWIPSFLLAH